MSAALTIRRSASYRIITRAVQREGQPITGLLTTDELTVIQSDREERAKWQVSPDRAYEVAQEFAQRGDAIVLLPSIAQHHVHNRRFVGNSIERAERLLEQIDALLGPDE